MASCKECYHYEVCRMHYQQKCELTYETEKEVRRAMLQAEKGSPICDHFKDRSLFVELPCKVGDKVYLLDNLHIKYADVIGIYIDAFGGVFDLRIYTNIQLANGFGYEYFISKDYTFEDIGKRIFLTKEAAEQALKERET